MKFSKATILAFIFIAISDALMYISYDGFNQTWSAFVVIPLRYLALILFVFRPLKKKWRNLIPRPILVVFFLLMFWNLVTIFRGFLFVTDYYDSKFIFDTSLLFLLIPLVFVNGVYLINIEKLFAFALKYLFRFGFVLIPLALVTNIQLYSRVMIPISIFIVIIPFLKPKWRILILIVAVTSILMYTLFRTNIVRIVIALLLVLTYYFRFLINIKLLKTLYVLLFITPMVFLFLALTNQFNVFKFQELDDKYNTVDNIGQERNYLDDNRTFLYAEVLSSLERKGNLILGEGAVGKYKSNYFDFGDRRGRYMSEIGFLNTLLFSGIIGFLIIFLFLFIVSYYALYKSNNWLSKMFGLFIACRWIIFFVEEFTLFDLNFFFYWILLGLISTNKFRSMKDSEVKMFFMNI
ncbi:hypothetical protein SAMN05443549_103138 [Flavobacterium fluvii]|uniref:O-Antigen ligase n=1 Tax=Flavobacterium fluvii TaxID=468056 RepID=A0A1M5IM62_9FLAO|nr:hypothetical protein [Flavobacterium fluvii]SHG28883.1 hypothetical protein SAMN05443549_103138 [Flavobacterium fluvii]